jgi:alkanesulfonate monooxygenase
MPTDLILESSPAQVCELQVFSTCPSSVTAPDNYLHHVRQVARWSEQAGCTGTLIYTDNSLVDPWMVAQVVVENTARLCPLVAVQPVYMHPYSAAKMAASIGFLYQRRIFFNMVAGGFKNDLAALDDPTPHDARYQRLVEYTLVMRKLLETRGPVTFEGAFYRVRNLQMNPPLAASLQPGILVSGSSEAGVSAARQMGAVAVKYPEPPGECAPAMDASLSCGVRIGIIARSGDDEAWRVACQRFPEDRKGQLTRQLATKVSDSAWHKRLSQLGDHGAYWLHPFENYQTNCPYLVGSYEIVSSEVGRYIAAGYRTFILDIPADQEEFEHIGAVFSQAANISTGRATA